MTSLDDLKASVSLLGLLEADGHALRRSGPRFVTRCPFHEERTPSFTVRDNRFRCYGCDVNGSVIDYVMQRDGVPLADAVRLLEQKAGAPIITRQPRPAPKQPQVPAPLTNAEIEQLCRASADLATRPDLCEKIAKRREWKPEVIRSLALEGSLGISDRKLAFIYGYGIKLRWKEGEKRRFAWHMMREGAHTLWRGDFLKLPGLHKVYLCEGETDAIAIVNSGAEEDGRTLAVAQPSASVFSREWGPLFRGKEVILCQDNDEAGRNAVERSREIIKPYARRVEKLKWEAVAA